MASAGQQIRIAIALAALTHKPAGQSVQAYILDLHATFSSDTPSPRSHLPNPWRERVLALEKDIRDLQEQHDKERLELLALRKAARSKPASSGVDGAQDDSGTPPAAATGAGKKAKAKKAKLSSAVVGADNALKPAPLPQAKLELSAILGGALADVPTVPSVSVAFDALDTMTDLLADDPLSVPPELVRSTTVRALRAVETVLALIVRAPADPADFRQPTSASGSGSSTTALTTHRAVLGLRDPVSVLDALRASMRRLVPTVLASLLAHHAACVKKAKATRSSVLTRARTSRARQASLGAIDDVLGGLYALVLSPLVRSFFVLSESFTAACFGARSSARSGSAAPSGSRANASATSTKSSGADRASLPVDARPAVLALVDDVLSTLEAALPGSAGAPPGPFSPLPSPAGVGAVPEVDHVKTLLALECVRELGKLYVPDDDDDDDARDSEGPDRDHARAPAPAEEPTGPSRARGHEDVNASRGSLLAAKTRAEASHGTTTGDRAGDNWDRDRQPLHGSAKPVPLPRIYTGTGIHSGGDDCTRPGTRTGWVPHGGSVRPRSGPARNLGETKTGTGLRVLGESVRRAAASAVPAPASAGVVLGGPGQVPDDPPSRTKTKAQKASSARTRGDDVVEKLARTDAGWYLCAVLHRVVHASAGRHDLEGRGGASGSPDASRGDGVPLQLQLRAHERDAVYDGLVDLLRRAGPCRSSYARLTPRTAAWGTGTGIGIGSDVEKEDAVAVGGEVGRRMGSKHAPQASGSMLSSVARGAGSSHGRGRGPGRGPGRGIGEGRMGEVERGMLLAVLERAWLGV